MTKEIDEIVNKELENYPNKDVRVYYQRESYGIVWGFFTWNGYGHTPMTFTEFREAGFEKSDIKELREEAAKLTIIAKSLGTFETVKE